MLNDNLIGFAIAFRQMLSLYHTSILKKCIANVHIFTWLENLKRIFIFFQEMGVDFLARYGIMNLFRTPNVVF